MSEAKTETLGEYGEAFGVSFQLIDDLLDFLSTPEAMGKPVGNDVKEGIYTLPLLLVLKGPSGKQIRLWLDKNRRNSGDHKDLAKILSECGTFDRTIQEIQKYNKAASDTIKTLGDNRVIRGLASLPDTYLEWALKHKATKMPN